VLFVAAAASTADAETLTEADVVRIARTRDARVVAAGEAASLAAAEEIRASLYPNPSLTWEREYLPVGSPTTENFLFVTLPVDLTGRRPAESALARSRASDTRAAALRTRNDAVVRSLDAFYTALAAERDAQILSRAVMRLDEAARVVRRRHEEGITAGYERARLEVEAELARSRLREAEARARAARATLTEILAIGNGAGIDLSGDLTTIDPPASGAPEERQSIRLLWDAEAEARRARAAAGWAWIPALSVSGGLRTAEVNDSRQGYVAGLSLSLPLFSRGQDLVAESLARGRLAAAEARAAEREARIEEARAREQLVSAREEISRFAASTGERIDRLERAALGGYHEGERSVTDLVDAERARTEVNRRRLDLELQAKRAELRLRAAWGEFE
jgi:cobalt-zinc-cadmium efflux system outer membrane protein